MQDLYAEFKAVIQGFGAEGIPYALCGGLAFAIHNDVAMPGVWEGREEVQWEGLPVRVVSRDGLIALKRLRGSRQDVADIERLSEPGDAE